jgi:prepilin peptidase dependent protein B
MNIRRQKGITLIELLVSMLLGIVVVGGVTTAYVAISSSASNTLTQNKLTQQLASIMTLMTRDVRRAGFRGNQTPADLLDPTTNVFNLANDTALEVHSAGNVQLAVNGGAGPCVLYAYDLDEDGVLDNVEISGFRLNAGAVQMRTSGDTVNNAVHDVCNDADDTWVNLSDPTGVTVTGLGFNLVASECLNTREPDGLDNDAANGIDDAAEADCYVQAAVAGSGDITVETRQVTITLIGQAVANANTTANITQDVRARNDLVRIN